MLDPGELEIVSSPTDHAGLLSAIVDTGHPAPQTYCFVRD